MSIRFSKIISILRVFEVQKNCTNILKSYCDCSIWFQLLRG